MQVLIRSDASSRIGGGHVMRCIALAEALRKEGAEVSFASRELPGHLCDFTESLGYRVIRLHSAESGATCETVQFNEILRSGGIKAVDWLVIDHYGINADWERRARAYCRHILVIDDLANRPHACDLLLDPNFSPDPGARYANLVDASCETLLGPHYALLRPEFAAARAAAPIRDGSVRRIFVFFGAGDPGGETLNVVTALAALRDDRLALRVVIGRANPRAAEIASACASLPGASCQVGSDDMAALMLQADLAIGAGGGTTWERCCVGLPSVIVAIADNQLPGSRALHQAGYALFLGRSAEVSGASIRDAVRGFQADPAGVRRMSLHCSSLVDGRGAARVTNAMMAADIALRRARDEDCIQVLDWRNHPQTRRYANDTGEISLHAHRLWYARKLVDPTCEFLIGELAGAPKGVLRYDVRGDQAMVSIYLAPGQQGRGFGRTLLRKGATWLSAKRPEIRRVCAEVLSENLRSAKAFEAAGFRFDGKRYYRNL